MRKYLAVASLVILIVGLALAVLACGGSDVAGTYKVSGNNSELVNVKMVLSDDGTFKLTAAAADSEQSASYSGTYTVDGDSITLKAEGIDETEKGTIEDGKLVFKSVTWVKE